MKRSAIRIGSAGLLMALVVAVSVSVIGATTAGEQSPPNREETYVWKRMQFSAQPKAQIRLYSADGLPVQTLTSDSAGEAVSEPMLAGTYYAFTEDCCAEFTLKENASVAAEGGCCWSDGEVLHLSSTEVGTVRIARPTTEQDAVVWLNYTLENDKLRRREVIRCTGSESPLTCTFEGIPYGTYMLLENGVEQCRVTLSAEHKDVTVALP